MLERLHGALVFERRVAVLARHLAALVPRDARVVDIGAGDGTVAALLSQFRPDVELVGVDVLARPHSLIPVTEFDGLNLPYEAGSFDVALLVDVTHHAEDPERLLAEARRVVAQRVLVKDHTEEGVLARPTLRFMDCVANRRHGVALPYRYWTLRQWDDVLHRVGLAVERWEGHLGLYPFPANLLFERSLHFVAALAPVKRSHVGSECHAGVAGS
jgi:SAM-dependent methyltransferase